MSGGDTDGPNFLFVNTFLDIDSAMDGSIWNPAPLFPGVPMTKIETNSLSTVTETMLSIDSGWEQASREAKIALAADFMRVFCGNPAMPPTDLVGCLDRPSDAGQLFARAMACVATAPAGR